MKHKKITAFLLGSVLLLTIPFSTVFAKPAAKSTDPLDQIVALHGNGLTKSELKQELRDYSEQTGISTDQLTAQVLAELKNNKAEVQPVRKAKPTKDKAVSAEDAARASSSSSSGGDGGVYQLDTSRKGTFFYQPASTLFVNHGHIGMYYTTTTIIEAANPDDGVRSVSVADRKVESGSRIMTTSLTSAAQDSAAADWAYSKNGRDYNSNFFFSRSCGGSSYNCSQLVWCAFKQVAGIDLDKDYGFGVYPVDIRDHNSVYDIRVY